MKRKIKKPFEELFIDKEQSIWFRHFKCPKCGSKIRTDFNFIYCSYVKCNWYDAYTEGIALQYEIKEKFRGI